GISSMSFWDSTLGWGIDPGFGTPEVPTLVYRWSLSTNVRERWQRLGMANDLHILNVYPNPFNVRTNISFFVPNRGPIKATISDMLGRSVDVLVDDAFVSGIHQLTWEGVHHASGVYFLKVSDGSQSVTSKLYLLK
ncbi:T9SS type A sorting domain-containing protein, partial [bacterium]|nr:T9SS type A sorting domain-containing protein [bacterium]